MNEKMKRIDDFLKMLKEMSAQNLDFYFTKSHMYYLLTLLGLKEEEQRTNIEEYFNTWIDQFSFSENCHVFVDPYWEYFCQFISKECVSKSYLDYIKVYVPLDSKHIKLGATLIFDYLSRENIKHVSKIGKEIRFDDIVIRLVNKEDVQKLIDFINSNEYLKEGLIQANPFCFNKDGIGLAVDGRLSYNSTLATLITNYINGRKFSGKFSSVSAEDFYNFVEDYYNYVFSSEHGLKKLNEDFGVNEEGRFLLSASEIVNLKEIISLILKSKNPSFTFESYLSHFEECISSLEKRKKEDEVINVMHGNYDNSHGYVSEELRSKTNESLLRTIRIMCEKYPNEYGVVNAISNYVITGDEKYITSYRNLRETLVRSSFRSDMSFILQVDQTDVFHYAYDLLNKKDNEKESRSTDEKFIIITIKEILEVMGRKYGEICARSNLENYIETGDISKITRDNNLRYRVCNSNFRFNLLTILQERGLKLSDYLRIVSSENIMAKEVYVERAIIETYKKSNKDIAETIVCSSLYRLIKDGNYMGITRAEGARENLLNNVSPDNVIEIIKKEFGLDSKEEINFEEYEPYIRAYVGRVIENNREVVL